VQRSRLEREEPIFSGTADKVLAFMLLAHICFIYFKRMYESALACFVHALLHIHARDEMKRILLLHLIVSVTVLLGRTVLGIRVLLKCEASVLGFRIS
jgi:hypothetical protein